MISDSSFPIAFGMLMCGMICWGSWPSAEKITRNWRTEFFHLDFSLGLFLASLLAIGIYKQSDPGAAFLKGLLEADRSAWLWALGGGAFMNAGNLALLAGIRRVGIAVAFPISVGLSIVVGTLLTYLVNPKGNLLFLGAGVVLIFLAVITNSVAYGYRKTDGSNKHRSINDLAICVVSGTLFMCSGPMFAKAISSTKPLDPNGTCILYALGSLIIAGPLLIYLTRHPIEERPFSFIAYLHGSTRNHLAGLIGGGIWGAGMLLVFLPANIVGPALALAVGQADPLVAALWGVLIWGEFRGAPASARALLASMFILYVAGLACLGFSYRAY
jgi:glucose uptake protein